VARGAQLLYCALAGIVIVLGLTACSDPYAARQGDGKQSPSPGVQNAGEPPAPPQGGTQAPIDVEATPKAALLQFASRYSNWSYRTLAREQLALSSISVGAARLSERQAAASTHADSTLTRSHISNSGTVLSVSADLARAGWWIVVTREHTSGGGEYTGLAAGYHVTLARLASVPGGWAVSQWLPQS
jgi:hypothetical protein